MNEYSVALLKAALSVLLIAFAGQMTSRAVADLVKRMFD